MLYVWYSKSWYKDPKNDETWTKDVVQVEYKAV